MVLAVMAAGKRALCEKPFLVVDGLLIPCSAGKKLVFDEQAERMVNGKVEFLDLKCSLGRDAEAEVAEGRKPSSALTGKTENLEPPCMGNLGRSADVGRVAGGRERDEKAAGTAKRHDELGKLQRRIDVVGDGGA